MTTSSPSATSTRTNQRAPQTAEYINPVLLAVQQVFEMMLGCEPSRVGLQLKTETSPDHELSAVIGLTGNTVGTLVVSFSEQTAFGVYEAMLGSTPRSLDSEVCDAVAELTNMIAGSAKAKLEHLQLTLSIPNMVVGKDHRVIYPSNVRPICIAFDSDLGPFSVEVGFAAA